MIGNRKRTSKHPSTETLNRWRRIGNFEEKTQNERTLGKILNMSRYISSCMSHGVASANLYVHSQCCQVVVINLFDGR
jgi:hypothetical protein